MTKQRKRRKEERRKKEGKEEGKKEGQKKGRERKQNNVTNINSEKGNIIIASTEVKEEYVNIMSNFVQINSTILMKWAYSKSMSCQN